jgi:hypothetical protein
MIDGAAPDYVEPLVGWRVWVVVGTAAGPRLRSVVQRTLWAPREPLLAECRRRRLLRRPRLHPAPAAGCHCGVYATGLEELEPLLVEAPWDTGTRVLGEVKLWGDVVECERGWRAARAYPARLFVPAVGGRLSQRALTEALAAYGVPVEPLPCRPGQAVAQLACVNAA